MKGLVLAVIAVAVAIALWRLVFTQEEDRKVIKAGVKELAIAGVAAVLVVGVAFFLLTTTTFKIL